MPDRNLLGERSPGPRTAHDRLRLIEERLQLGSWSWDVVTNQMYWSPGLYALLGLDAAVVQPSLSFFETLVHPRDQLALEEPHSLAIDPRQRNRRFRIIRPDGQLRWLQSAAQTIFDRTGKPIGVNAVVTEVTELEDERQRAASDRALLLAVTQLLDVRLWKADTDGRLLESIGATSDLTPGDQSVTSWRDLVYPDDLEAIATEYRNAVARRGRYDIAPRIIAPDGSVSPLYVSGMPLDPEIAGEGLWGGIASTTQRGGVTGQPRATGSAPEAMSSMQIRACRAFLDWSADELARRANVSVSTIRRLEGGSGARPHPDSTKQIRAAFETAGLNMWTDQDGRFCLSGPAV